MCTYKNDEHRLELLKRILTDSGNLYLFRCDGKEREYTKEQGIRIIRDYAAQDRNCQTDGKTISLKAGYGNIDIIDSRTDRGKITDKNISLLCHGDIVPLGINIFTGAEYRKICDVFSNDVFFTEVGRDAPFMKRHRNYLWEIDNAKMINYTTYKIETPFGTDSVDELSTGLKTLLNTVYLKENSTVSHFVNISECGMNIVPYLFREVNNSCIGLYTEHTLVQLKDSEKLFSEYTVYINTKMAESVYELNQTIRREGAYTWSLN